MNSPSLDSEIRVQPPRTVTVLGLILAAAMSISWLLAYALTETLVSAELLRAWPAGNDPRPRWFLTVLVLMLTCFLLAAMCLRWLSSRQLARIDRMSDET